MISFGGEILYILHDSARGPEDSFPQRKRWTEMLCNDLSRDEERMLGELRDNNGSQPYSAD